MFLKEGKLTPAYRKEVKRLIISLKEIVKNIQKQIDLMEKDLADWEKRRIN